MVAVSEDRLALSASVRTASASATGILLPLWASTALRKALSALQAATSLFSLRSRPGDKARGLAYYKQAVQDFNDDAPSIPVPFASSRWGSLASFGARTYPGTKRMYGTSGNSFVAVVEFGDRLTAKAITVGGLHNDPDSPHFDDQAQMYANGEFRDVLFYRKDVEANLEREYNPGQ